MMASSATEDQRVVLNVGGMRFETLHSTLLNIPDSLLGLMFSDRNSNICKPDPDGVYFFDRNSACFSAILDGYRSNGDLICPPTVAERTFQQELDFWQIPRDDIQDSSSSIHSTSPSNLLSPSDRKTLERTLMIMDSAQSMGLNNIEFLVDLDGNVAGMKPSLCVGNSQKLWWSEIGVIVASVLEGDAQTREDGDRRVDVFEQALRERTGLGKVLRISEIRKTLTVRRPAVVPPSTAMEDGVDAPPPAPPVQPSYISHWECNLVVP